MTSLCWTLICDIQTPQVPLPFVISKKTTYEVGNKGQKEKVWVAQPSQGLEKRQCTLQICFSPEENHVKIEIIFRGTGKRISPAEKKAYHKDVDIYFQKNAWADTDFSCEWIKKTLEPGVKSGKEGNKEFILLCDNLSAQVTDDFKKAVRDINGIVYYGPSGATDLWQPVDAAYGSTLKKLITQEQDQWLELEDNIDKWLGNSEKPLTASDRRILISEWVGNANKKMQDKTYDKFRWRCFEKTGCLITADGSDDSKISPEGLSDYKVPPPLPMRGPGEYVEDGTPNAAIEPEDIAEQEDILEPSQATFAESELVDVTSELSDSVQDRVYDDFLVGKTLQSLYEGGFRTGMIDYYNRKLKEYHVLYEDCDEDYVKYCDIDGLEHNIVL